MVSADLRSGRLRKLTWSAAALLALLGGVGLLRLGGGWATPPAPPPPEASAAQPVPADYVPLPAARPVRQVSVLGVWARMAGVMIAAYALLLGVRWWKAHHEQEGGPAAFSAAAGERSMQVKESLRLGAGWDLHLLQVEGHLLVVGSNAAHMTLLGQVPIETAPLASSLPPLIEQEPARPAPRPEAPASPPAKIAGLREREWEQRRAHLIDALRRQVVE